MKYKWALLFNDKDFVERIQNTTGRYDLHDAGQTLTFVQEATIVEYGLKHRPVSAWHELAEKLHDTEAELDSLGALKETLNESLHKSWAKNRELEAELKRARANLKERLAEQETWTIWQEMKDSRDYHRETLRLLMWTEHGGKKTLGSREEIKEELLKREPWLFEEVINE